MTTQGCNGDDEPAELLWHHDLEDKNSETVKNMSPLKVTAL